MKKVNFTIEIEERAIPVLESALKKHFKIISFKHLPDTNLMYEKSKGFRDLIAKEKEIKKSKADFIHEFNDLYKAKK